MTGPETPAEQNPAASRAPSSFSEANSLEAPPTLRKPIVLKKRREFLAAARARRWVAKGMLVQGRRRKPDEPAGAETVRVGYTCSKKVGNAVARNRAKRRLRAAAAEVLPLAGRPGWDYVLIGKAGATIERPFVELVGDLKLALEKVHERKKK